MAYKALIFDFFGVFAPDVFPMWLAKHNLNGPKLKTHFNDLAKNLDENNIDRVQFLLELARNANITLEDVEYELNDFSINEKLIKILPRLSRNYKLALICNASSQIIRPIFVKYEIEHYFNQIIISSEVGVSKPQAEIYLLMLDRLSIKPSEAVFIDDRQTNIDGAEAIGIKGILYNDFKELVEEFYSLGLMTVGSLSGGE